MSNILCIDERERARRLEDALSAGGHRTRLASTLAQGLSALDEEPADLVIAGASLFRDADQVLRTLRDSGHEVPILFLNGASGASPDAYQGLRRAVDRALVACDLPRAAGTPLVGEAASLREVLNTLRAVAPTRATVLLEGESGTGKELLVRALHAASPRGQGPLVAVNCAALPEGLVESTLFGHERGAFTGASARVLGAFERAQGGTLLLDEISELHLDLQAKLLRALQERQIERVGGARVIPVDVRVVATTNRNLEAEVAAGRFRADLYYRLRVIPVVVPPLRARREDIPLLARHFAERTALDLGVPVPGFLPETLAVLTGLPWPGNVRELEHAVERAVILRPAGPLTPDDFKDARAEAPAALPGQDPGILDLRVLERQAIERALAATQGHRQRAAKLLGISDRTLRSKLREYREEAGGGRSVLPIAAAASSASPSGRAPLRRLAA